MSKVDDLRARLDRARTSGREPLEIVMSSREWAELVREAKANAVGVKNDPENVGSREFCGVAVAIDDETPEVHFVYRGGS